MKEDQGVFSVLWLAEQVTASWLRCALAITL